MKTIAVSIDFPEKHSRLTTFFRLPPGDPAVHRSATCTRSCALLCTYHRLVRDGDHRSLPQGLCTRSSAAYVRFYLRFAGYVGLAVDAYPPFSGTDNPDYPVHVTVPERPEHYSRLLALFRIIYIIPLGILVSILAIVFVDPRHSRLDHHHHHGPSAEVHRRPTSSSSSAGQRSCTALMFLSHRELLTTDYHPFRTVLDGELAVPCTRNPL